jgi:hypothetical protein
LLQLFQQRFHPVDLNLAVSDQSLEPDNHRRKLPRQHTGHFVHLYILTLDHRQRIAMGTVPFAGGTRLKIHRLRRFRATKLTEVTARALQQQKADHPATNRKRNRSGQTR